MKRLRSLSGASSHGWRQQTLSTATLGSSQGSAMMEGMVETGSWMVPSMPYFYPILINCLPSDICTMSSNNCHKAICKHRHGKHAAKVPIYCPPIIAEVAHCCAIFLGHWVLKYSTGW